MGELSQIIEAKTKAAVVYLVQRDDCETFAIAADLDPVYAKAAETAHKCGVQTMAAALAMDTSTGVHFKGMLPII
jgi:sugar fermentation stimulation protein A